MSQAEDDLSSLRRGMRGLSFQIDAHNREDDARREKNQSCVDDMEGVFMEEVDSGEDCGSRLMEVNGEGWADLAVVHVPLCLLRNPL